MVRQILARTTSPSPYPTAGLLLVETAEDITNHSRVFWQGKEIVVIHNTGASTYTYTITGVADLIGRNANIGPQNILAGEVHIVGPFTPTPGWIQTDGYLYFDASNASVKFGVIVIP